MSALRTEIQFKAVDLVLSNVDNWIERNDAIDLCFAAGKRVINLFSAFRNRQHYSQRTLLLAQMSSSSYQCLQLRKAVADRIGV